MAYPLLAMLIINSTPDSKLDITGVIFKLQFQELRQLKTIGSISFDSIQNTVAQGKITVAIGLKFKKKVPFAKLVLKNKP